MIYVAVHTIYAYEVKEKMYITSFVNVTMLLDSYSIILNIIKKEKESIK